MKPTSQRRIDNVLGALREDVASARDLVGRGRQAYDSDRLLRLSAEAILGRIGEAAKILPDGVAEEIFGDDRAAWIGQRIVVDHIYHRLDYGEVWATIETDVAGLGERLSDRDKRMRNLQTAARVKASAGVEKSVKTVKKSR